MMPKQRTNEQRAHSGMEAALRHRITEIGERSWDGREALADLLADLRHAFSAADFEAAVRVSLDHWSAETGAGERP